VARGGRQARRLLDALGFLATETTLLADVRAEPDLVDAELARLDRPVHLFYGDRSPCLPAGQRLAAAFPDASLTVLPGGHYLHLDATDALTRHLVEVCGG